LVKIPYNLVVSAEYSVYGEWKDFENLV
jgi:hypothetical protein